HREAHRESEERFRFLAKATTDAIWDWDLKTNSLWWNEGFETLFGFAPNEIESGIESWYNRIHPEDRERVTVGIHDAIDSGEEEWWDEYRFFRKDGSSAYVLDRGYIIQDDDGKPVRMIGGMTDQSERKRSEDKLREQAALLDKAQDAIIVRDLGHRILYWNRSAERLYGWSDGEAVGQSEKDLLHKSTNDYHTAMETTLARGEWTGEMEHRTRDNWDLTVESRWTLVRNEKGEPDSILTINTDITARKKLEQQFLRAQRLESIGTLAGGIAHDLNNVLAPIMMSIGILKLNETDEKRLRLLSSIESSAQRGADMVNQVLSFARGVEGCRVSMNPMYVVRDIQRIINDTFPKNIDFTLTAPQNLWTVNADPTQLQQVLMNLCVNARDAMESGGVLTMTLENTVLDEIYSGMNPDSNPGPYVVISVEDTGTGIPRELRERIFDPFFTTKEVGKGTGLGLATGLLIVKAHGGFINLYSEIGKGSRFKVYLPATATPESTEKVAREQTQLPQGNDELILIADDEEGIRIVTEKTLERFGYRVLVAKNGAEAVALYAQHGNEVAAVLLDMAMPVMDGPSTIIALKAMNPEVRIIGSSGQASNGGVAKAVGAGVNHFVPKPYTAETLLKTLRELLDPPDEG
ncbi:MAG: PAS domain S-box protein, partial [Candidatus Dadabacteria bacterium]